MYEQWVKSSGWTSIKWGRLGILIMGTSLLWRHLGVLKIRTSRYHLSEKDVLIIRTPRCPHYKDTQLSSFWRHFGIRDRKHLKQKYLMLVSFILCTTLKNTFLIDLANLENAVFRTKLHRLWHNSVKSDGKMLIVRFFSWKQFWHQCPFNEDG